MIGNITTNKTADSLKAILEKHRDKRVCVIGTMCCGKTTLIKQLTGYNCIDMDDEFWPQASKKEYEFYSKRPFTKEMNRSLYNLFCERVLLKPGYALFGIYILDCEVVVYLDIPEKLLREHCEKRGDTDFTDAHNIKKWIEEDLNNHKVKNGKLFYYLTVQE